jgi:hypothetical protein
MGQRPMYLRLSLTEKPWSVYTRDGRVHGGVHGSKRQFAIRGGNSGGRDVLANGRSEAAATNGREHLPLVSDGRHGIAEIVPRLSATLHDVKAPLREYVCLRLLSGAQAEQFIESARWRF